jgi:hypothetical protein
MALMVRDEDPRARTTSITATHVLGTQWLSFQLPEFSYTAHS